MSTTTLSPDEDTTEGLGFEHAGLFAETEDQIVAGVRRVRAAANGDSNDEELAAYADLVETLLAALNVTTR